MVRLARPEDVPALADVLTRAFARDPFFAYLAGDAPERNARMREAWTGILRHASARLTETWTTDDLAGAAIWLPPGHRPSLIDGLRMLRHMARFAGWRRLRLVSDAVEVLERHRRRHVPGPHFYLSALGVDPDRQGSGIGTDLMGPTLAACDDRGVPAYLETAVARNVLLYERVGFEVVEELILPRTDIRGWLMRRPPVD
ncbi:MAG TPA: GNAT family N-acetyltransferase [Candidatus Angelobacter sp.]|nr:GNAT family N-acetyltransferase [Candidatus Angelobacter sp.]